MNLKPGDFYCVTSMVVDSHGLMIRNNRINRRVKEDDIISFGIEYLQVQVSDSNVAVPTSKIGHFWLDTEARGTHVKTWYLIYPAMMPRAEVDQLIKVEAELVVRQLVEKYERALINSKELLAKVQTSDVEGGDVFNVIVKEKK